MKIKTPLDHLYEENSDLKKRLEDAMGEIEHLRDDRCDNLSSSTVTMQGYMIEGQNEAIRDLKSENAQLRAEIADLKTKLLPCFRDQIEGN